jgi:predicted  nucleic acid-binding Zn-ribbon protein
MKDTIELLFALQQLDDEIDDLRADEEAIPGKKDELAAEVGEIETKLKVLKQEALDLAKLRKEKEIDLEAASQKKAKFQGQLFQVKSNREYEALQHEISGLDAQVSGFEDEILEILERAEKVSEAAADEENALKATMERVKQEHTALDREADGLRQAIAARDGKRADLVSGLDQPLLTRYERIREVKDGLAVAAIKNGACGGCFRRIPPQEMQILRRADRVMICEGCGRIILWRGDEQ